MPKFNLDDYETVEDRLRKFWEDHEDGRIESDLVAYSDTQFIVKASIFFDGDNDNPTATGLAEEIVGASPVNKTSALENAETSAIGRALANCGYATKGKRPSREEMQKVQRGTVKSVPAPKLSNEEMVRLADVVKAVDVMVDDTQLKEVWDAHLSILDTVLGDGSTLRAAITARKSYLEGE